MFFHQSRFALKLSQSISILVMVLFAAVAYAQQLTNGYVFGVVLSEGEPVEGAEISIENTNTGMFRKVQTSSSGAYRLSSLPTGIYDVLVMAPGLKPTACSIEIDIGLGTRSDFDLLSHTAHAHGVDHDEGFHGHKHEHATHEHNEELLVSTSHQSDVRGSFGEIHTLYCASEISQLPIPRDINAVVNMAPGTVIGHSRYSITRSPLSQIRTTEFGLVSIHGASIAKNVFYVEGMNVSNLSNGLGASVLPFEFYDQIQLITGG